MTTRIVCISDTHGEHRKLDVPEGDILIHAGDFSNTGEEDIIADFGEWLGSLPHTYKVVVPGNHDRSFQGPLEGEMRDLIEPYAHVLIDQCERIGGFDIYGMPWSPNFYEDRWAFNQPRNSAVADIRYQAMYNAEPDIVISHTPPMGILDTCPDTHDRTREIHVGCEVFAEYLEKAKPRLAVVGHIHEAYGLHMTEYGTLVVNACNMTGRYKLKNAPIVINTGTIERNKLQNSPIVINI